MDFYETSTRKISYTMPQRKQTKISWVSKQDKEKVKLKELPKVDKTLTFKNSIRFHSQKDLHFKKRSFLKAELPNQNLKDLTLVNIMVIDDEQMNIELLNTFIKRFFNVFLKNQKILKLYSFNEYEAGCVSVEELFKSGVIFDLVFTDFNLDSGHNGLEVHEFVVKQCKKFNIEEPKFILVSGEKLENKESSNKFVKMLQKPFGYDDLKLSLEQFFEKVVKN